MKAIKLVFMLALLGFGAPMITACENEESGFEEMGEGVGETGEEIGEGFDETGDEIGEEFNDTEY